MLKSIGEGIVYTVNYAVVKFERKILRRLEPRNLQLKSVVVIFVLMSMQVITNGLIGTNVEGWTFVEGIYFGFVTSSTIGFGDYMPSPLRSVKTNIQQALAGNTTVPSSDGATDTIFWHPADIVRGIIFFFVLTLDLCLASSVLNSAVAPVEEWKSQPPQYLGCIQSKKIGERSVCRERNNTSLQITRANYSNFFINKCSVRKNKIAVICVLGKACTIQP